MTKCYDLAYIYTKMGLVELNNFADENNLKWILINLDDKLIYWSKNGWISNYRWRCRLASKCSFWKDCRKIIFNLSWLAWKRARSWYFTKIYENRSWSRKLLCSRATLCWRLQTYHLKERWLRRTWNWRFLECP